MNPFMKRLVFLMAALMLLSACRSPAIAADPVSEPAASPSFADVPADAYYAEAVQWAVAQGITKGTSAAAFSPDSTCTRAQIVTFLHRAAGSPEAAGGTVFSDVPEDAYYADAVRWAVAEGITRGTSETAFSPDAPCTRAQIVTFLHRAAGSPEAADAAAFSDVSDSAYYAGAVRWAVAGGVTRGTGADRFSPDKTCTRAEAVTFLYRSARLEPEPPEEPEPPASGRHILVACFSATGNTRPLAEAVAALLDADYYEITPAEPYTEADLAYYTDCRADREQKDPDARPAISGQAAHMEQYDTVVIAHPIWHGQAPRIISTFLESYDFSGKTLTTFCTSHSSPLGSSAQNLHALVPDSVTWLESRRFAAGASGDALAAWLTEIGLLEPEQEEEPALQLTVNGVDVSVLWEDNESVAALIELVREGPLTIQMSPYGGFEQVGPIGQSLPRDDVQTTTRPGDLVLYSGNQIVAFYGSNTWAYTRLGRIQEMDPEALTALLGGDAVSFTLSPGTDRGIPDVGTAGRDG